MTATFPGGVKTFAAINPGDPILSSTENAQQEEIVAIEQALLGEITDGNVQYVKKPATSTDNAIPRFDGTDGKKLQNSGVIINDNGQLSGNGLDGWIYDTDTWSYVSATSFKISGKDVRYKFPKGTKIKLVQSGSTKYFYVTATAYSADTTITITGGSDYSLADADISGQAYSFAAAPQGFPEKFNHNVTTYTGWAATPTRTVYFKLIGNLMTLFVSVSGTSNGTGAEINLPCASNAPITMGALGFATDNGIVLPNSAKWFIEGNSSLLKFNPKMDWSGWTATGEKEVIGVVQYLI